MNFLKNLFGNLNLDVNKLVDNVVTTDEERKSLKVKLKQILAQAEGSAQEQVTRRWEADSKAGWLPANIRPLTLVFLTLVFVIISVASQYLLHIYPSIKLYCFAYTLHILQVGA